MEPKRSALLETSILLTGDQSAILREEYLPQYHDRYVPHEERANAFRALVDAGLISPVPDGIVRRFECATCWGTGDVSDAHGLRDCWSCGDGHRDENIPTTVLALASWTSLGRETIELAERSVVEFLSIAKLRWGWTSMEGSRDVFGGGGFFGPPACEWTFGAVCNPDAPRDVFTASEWVAKNTVLGGEYGSLRVDGSMPDGEVITPVRALWDARIVLFNADASGVTLKVRGLGENGSARGKK